ncbi:S-4TM family putative pore-forming effector [Aeromonas cavernicola]|uniref:S-4TM family putative pore-forming effector n=1 Tax=Aeromonas cavernicola TaxID=1006623 RepID=UPI00191C82C9
MRYLYEERYVLILAYVVAPLASTYIFGYRQMIEHGDTASRFEKLKWFSEKIWSDALDGKDLASIKAKCRALQDQIFEHRKKSHLYLTFSLNGLPIKVSRLCTKGLRPWLMSIFSVM